MSGVGVGMEQADRDRLDVLGPEELKCLIQRVEAERSYLIAVVIHAPHDFAAEISLHEGGRLLVHQVKKVWPVAPTNLEGIPEPLGGNQAHFRPFALGEGIDDDCGAVREHVDRANIDIGAFKYVEHALFEIGRSGV